MLPTSAEMRSDLMNVIIRFLPEVANASCTLHSLKGDGHRLPKSYAWAGYVADTPLGDVQHAHDIPACV